MELNRPDIAPVPESKCLACGKQLNMIGTADGTEAKPEPGGVVACIRCGAVMQLGPDLRLAGFTEEEMAELAADGETMRDLARVVKGIHLVRHQQG